MAKIQAQKREKQAAQERLVIEKERLVKLEHDKRQREKEEVAAKKAKAEKDK